LLTAAGFEFETISPNVEERFDADLTLCELTLFNARRKAAAVARLHPEAVVLAADTLVALDGEIIAKPIDLKHATRILQRLSGRVHEVCSAVCIFHFARTRSTSFHEVSRVRFRLLNRNQIDEYISKVNPLDKAGAYAAQGHGAEVIAQIDGSFTNVVGLPMEKTVPVLHSFGIVPKSAV
jgi:septum formation protein